MDSFVISNRNTGWLRNARAPEREADLSRFETVTSTSTWAMAYETSISQRVVLYIILEECMHTISCKNCTLCRQRIIPARHCVTYIFLEGVFSNLLQAVLLPIRRDMWLCFMWSCLWVCFMNSHHNFY